MWWLVIRNSMLKMALGKRAQDWGLLIFYFKNKEKEKQRKQLSGQMINWSVRTLLVHKIRPSFAWWIAPSLYWLGFPCLSKLINEINPHLNPVHTHPSLSLGHKESNNSTCSWRSLQNYKEKIYIGRTYVLYLNGGLG